MHEHHTVGPVYSFVTKQSCLFWISILTTDNKIFTTAAENLQYNEKLLRTVNVQEEKQQNTESCQLSLALSFFFNKEMD